MEIIKAETQEQIKQCLEVRKQVFVIEQEVPESLEVDDYDSLENKSCIHILVLDQGTPVAAGRIISYFNNAAKFQRIAVLPAYREAGLGSQLLKAMEQESSIAGYESVILDSQCHAEPFYLKNGYIQKSPEIFMDAGIPHVRMTKPLFL
jgi:predicted GNAT family N-acyltransferase